MGQGTENLSLDEQKELSESVDLYGSSLEMENKKWKN